MIKRSAVNNHLTHEKSDVNMHKESKRIAAKYMKPSELYVATKGVLS
jgi:hypothetical protein